MGPDLIDQSRSPRRDGLRSRWYKLAWPAYIRAGRGPSHAVEIDPDRGREPHGRHRPEGDVRAFRRGAACRRCGVRLSRTGTRRKFWMKMLTRTYLASGCLSRRSTRASEGTPYPAILKSERKCGDRWRRGRMPVAIALPTPSVATSRLTLWRATLIMA